MPDQAYASTGFRVSEVEHRYGEDVHLLDDPLALTLLARLSSEETSTPEAIRVVRRLYERLASTALAAELPRARLRVRTRMISSSPRAVFEGTGLDRSVKVVTAAIARAGIVPSQVCFDLLCSLVDHAGVRQDHISMARQTDAAGSVTGVSLHDSKIGGDVEGRVLLFPDPMGATGRSLSRALAHYRDEVRGTPSGRVTLNLIVTPEFIRRIIGEHPGVHVWALRLDRGLSDEDVLTTVPGTHPERERGLDDHQYIVPGAGGLGEVLNNSWV